MSAASGPSLVVIVVNWNRADLTIRCVEAVVAQGADVVVVDNGSAASDVATLTSWAAGVPSVTLVRNAANGGFAAGVNAGFRASTAELVVLLNNDAVPAPDFIAALRRAEAAASVDVAALTARIELSGSFVRIHSQDPAALVSADGSRWQRADDGVRLLNSTGGRVDRAGNGSDRNWLDPIDTPAPRAVFGFSGGAVLLRRAALDDVGLFDESLFMYYEDTELAWRFARRGWRVEYEATAVVRHDHAGSSGTSSDLFVGSNARNRNVVALWHAPWGVVARGALRTLVRALLLLRIAPTRHEGRVVTRALASAWGSLPRHLAHRRRIDRAASVRRAAIRTDL